MSLQDARKQLTLLVNSHYPIIYIETWEEGRATEALSLVAGDLNLAEYAEITASQAGWRFDLAVVEEGKPSTKDINGAPDFSADDIERFERAPEMTEELREIIEPDIFSHGASDSTSFRRLTTFFDSDSNGPQGYRHLKIEIRVPSPTFE